MPAQNSRAFSLFLNSNRVQDNEFPESNWGRYTNVNIVSRLITRETFFVRPSVSAYHAVRKFHRNIVPNSSLTNIVAPPSFHRKFSPDGKYLISFSNCRSFVEIYKYRGPSAGETFLRSIEGQDDYANAVRSNIFYDFFQLKHSIHVVTNTEKLDTLCILFTDDCNFVIVGSSALVPEGSSPPMFQYRSGVESYSYTRLENFTLYLIDMEVSVVSDKRIFVADKLFLTENYSLYLYHDLLCVLSVQHQTIHVYQITKEGSFIDIRCIGRPCHERLFQLRMWKMQMLDKMHVLINYCSEEVITSLGVPDPVHGSGFFVIYNIDTNEILCIYENSSETLLWIFENFYDLFQNASSHLHGPLSYSPSSNYARLRHRICRQPGINHYWRDTLKEILSELPVECQYHSISPYLDLSLFGYDDQHKSIVKSLMLLKDLPLRVYARFNPRLHVFPQGNDVLVDDRQMSSAIFHPYDPFVISVFKNSSETIMNLHIRHTDA